MARKIARYTVADEGRDKGKIFVLTEMPASQAEAWALRALLALMNGNVDIPEGFESTGMAGMAEIGLKALSGLKWQVAGPLLDEMWQCVQIQPDPANAKIVRALIEEDVEEIKTRMTLRIEVWKLHMDFLKGVARFAFPKKPVEEAPKGDLPNIEMSPQ